ncbi:MAG TPA: VWA domain-containing protein [Terriglobales bacterium]|nr:VWA domain-containing protein [Terriglobales bacterium]
MLWGVPAALLLFVGAIPLILFLHSLKPRGLRVNTTTLFLWERVLKERPLGTRLGWLLRKNLLLILQLLAAASLIIALAEPSLRFFGARPGDLVVVLDMSASMKARGKNGTRFEAARKQLLSLIDNLASEQRMLVIGAGAQPRLLVPFSADKRRLRQLASGLDATDAAGRVKEAIDFAHAFLKRDSADQVVVVSDGAFAGAENYAKPAAHLRFVKVDGGQNNLAILGFEVRRSPVQGTAEIMVHLRNFTAKPVRVPLTLRLDDKVIAHEEVAINADDRRVWIYPYAGSLTGTLSARIEVEDDFATDNQAYLVADDEPVQRVHYVGPGNPYLIKLFRLFPNIELTSAPRWESPPAQEPYDVMIFDRVPAPALTRGNVILIDTVAPNLGIALSGKAQNPQVIPLIAEHPLMEGLSLSEIHVQEALRATLKGEGTVLVRSAAGPLAIALEQRGLHVLFIAFNLLASDLPLRVAFPVLFHNALQWFQPQRLEFPAQSTAAGAPFAIPVTAAGTVEIVTPTGAHERVDTAVAPAVFTDTTQTGLYDFKSATRKGRFAVNLFDEAESAIAPRVNFAAARDQAAESSAGQTGLSLWPGLLMLVVALLALELLLAYRQAISLSPIALRAVALTAICLAVINPRLLKATTGLDVVIGVDLSRSVGQAGREKAQEVLAASRHIKKADVRTGLLSFGRVPEWEFLPRPEVADGDFGSRLDREETDIQAVLQAAMAQAGDGRQEKILLISDGNENRGEVARVLPQLRAQDVQVWSLPVGLARGRNEVYLSDLTVPRQVDSAEGFEIHGAIESLRAAPARVRLLRDGALQAERDIQLNPGTNAISFRDSLTARGNHSYELLVESPDDTLAANNLLQGVVEVKGPPRVLLLSGQGESQRVISRVLQVQGYAVTEATPERESLTLADLSAYDLLVLDNVPALQLSHAKMENIEKYVRDLGGGLFVIGGSQSYGAGGYYRTPLERILPVEMRPPARLEMPHVALLFVLDKSGSMGAGAEGSTKLDLAKAAALAAADIMNPTDQVGILAFDANWDWALPFRPVGKGEWISDRLAALQSDGGTDLYKAMLEAQRGIALKQAAIKHVIVLSDGLTDKADFHALAGKMARDGVTVSTVSVGNDADVQLMADIAKDGKGRGYVALDPQTIPQIFTTETLLISRDLLIEKPVFPTMVTHSGPLKGIASSSRLPALRGYVLTYPKPRAELLMLADKDPLLVAWRYGLGRVTAFTSDLSGRWGRDWVAWSGFAQWTSQISRDTMRKILGTGVRTEFYRDGESIKVVTDLASRDGKFLNHLKLKANISAPNQTTEVKSLQQSAPGRYEGEFVPAVRGIHFLTLYAEGDRGDAPLRVATVPYVVPYPKEYRQLKPNLPLLSRLAEETGGEMLDPENFAAALQRFYTPTPGRATRAQDTWWPLAGVGLMLFMVDLVLRNLPRKSRDFKTIDSSGENRHNQHAHYESWRSWRGSA